MLIIKVEHSQSWRCYFAQLTNLIYAHVAYLTGEYGQVFNLYYTEKETTIECKQIEYSD